MKYFLYVLYLSGLFLYTFNLVVDIDSYHISIFLGLFFSAAIIPTVFLISKTSIFEPILWFSIYYYVLIYSEFVTLQSNFHISTFFQNSYFYTDKLELFSKTVWTVLIAYILFLVGYSSSIKKNIEKQGSFFVKGISFKLLKISAYLFMLIALINFIYNINAISGLDIVSYYKKISYYSGHLVDFGVTILGYNFMYPSMFFILYLYLNKRVSKFTFLLFFIIFLILESSLGRITGFGMSIVIIYLVFLYAQNEFYLNYKKVMLMSIGMTVIVALFFLRMFSEYNRVFDMSINDFVATELNNITFILIGEGNLPNIGIIMKIIDSWESDIGFLHGSSIFVGFVNFLPSSLSVNLIEENTVSWIIKRNWYSDIHGGGLPPTVIGDLYANFSFLGVFIGMLILGYTFAQAYNLVIKKRNYFIFIVYAYFLVRFVFILPKGEFSRISVMLIPAFIIGTVYIVNLITHTGKKDHSL